MRQIIFALMAVLVAAVGYTDYDRMVDEIDNYTPPTSIDSGVALDAPGQSIERDRGFADALKSIEKLTSRQLGRLETPEFYHHATGAPPVLTGNFTLGELEAATFAGSPAIEAAHLKARAAIEGFGQVARLDEILSAYLTFTEGVMTGVGPMKGNTPASMKFPLPSITSLKGRVAAARAEEARLGYEKTVRDVLTGVRSDYWNLVYIEQALEIQGENLTLLVKLERVVKTLYETGKSNFSNVLTVQVKERTLEEMIGTLKNKRSTLEASIVARVGLAVGTKIGSPVDSFTLWHGLKVPGIGEVANIALENRQELSLMRTRLKKMEAMLEMAETMALPAFDLGLTRFDAVDTMQTGSAAMSGTFPTSTRSGTGVGTPVKPWYGTRDSYLGEIRLKIAALKSAIAQLEGSTVAMVTAKWSLYDKALREYGLYEETVIDSAKAALEVSMKGYEAGRVVFPEVIAATLQLLKAKLERARRMSELGIAISELEKTAGAMFITAAGEK